MKIIWNYIFIFTGLSVLLQLSGIQIAGLSQLFTYLGITANSSGLSAVNYSPFEVAVLAILATATISQVIIGIFSRASPENYLVVTLTGTSLIFWISAIFSIMSSVNSGFVGYIMGLIMIPFVFGMIYALVDWFRGGDF